MSTKRSVIFALEPCVELDSSLAWFEHELLVPMEPNEAFDFVLDHDQEATWFPDFESARWLTGTEPLGVGSLREYRTRSMRAIELFTAWERGAHLRFTFVSLSLPICRRFAEDYRFTSIGDRQTRITWRICYEPSVFVSPVLPIVRSYFKNDFELAARQLAQHVNGTYVHGECHDSPSRKPAARPDSHFFKSASIRS